MFKAFKRIAARRQARRLVKMADRIHAEIRSASSSFNQSISARDAYVVAAQKMEDVAAHIRAGAVANGITPGAENQ